MSKYRVEILDECPELPVNTSLFGSKKWWDFQKQVWGHDLRCLVVWEKDKIQAWHFYLEYNTTFFKRIVDLPFQAFGGPFYGTAEQKFSSKLKKEEELLTVILNFLSQKADQVQIFSPQNSQRPFLSSQFEPTIKSTLFANFHQFKLNSDIRRQLNKAAQKNYSRTAQNINIEELLVQSYNDLLIQKNVNPYFARQSIKAWELSSHYDFFCRIQIVDENHKLVSAALNCVDHQNESAWNLLNPTRRDVLKDGVAYLLYWEMIQELKDYDLDLMGADHQGVSYFKEQFAYRLESKIHWEKFSSPVKRILWNLRTKL